MRRGIDVSVHNGTVDWAAVKSSGIDFAMVKATQGRSVTDRATYKFTDRCFARNITGSAAAGLDVGVYHYLTAQSVGEAMEEAEYFVSVLEPYRSCISLYAAVDVEEDRYLPQDKKLLSQIVHTFCSRLVSAGYDPIVYTNPNYLAYRLNDVSAWPLWLALWRDKTAVPTLEQYPNLRIWQWGEESVSDIGGNADANFMIREKPEPKVEETKTHKEETKVMIDNTPSDWAKDAVAWAQENKILLGGANGDLGLHRAVTVEQMCVMLRRLHDLSVDHAEQRVVLKLLAALGGTK